MALVLLVAWLVRSGRAMAGVSELLAHVDLTTTEGMARVQVEFADYGSLLKYLGELNAGEQVQRWVLVSAQSQAARTATPAGAAGAATVLLSATCVH